MANTTSSLSTQPKGERKIGPKQVIGGLFENVWEQFTGISPVNEGPVKNPDLEQLAQMPELHKGSFPSTGEITNFQVAKPESRAQQIREALAQAHLQTQISTPVEEKRVRINELNSLQLLYGGSVDAAGNVTAYHEANSLTKQAETLVQRIQEERARKLAEAKKVSSSSSKGVLGPKIDLNRAFEDQNTNRPG